MVDSLEEAEEAVVSLVALQEEEAAADEAAVVERVLVVEAHPAAAAATEGRIQSPRRVLEKRQNQIGIATHPIHGRRASHAQGSGTSVQFLQ